MFNFDEKLEFKFQDKKYKYFFGNSKILSTTERIVEIPIIQDYLDGCISKQVLEVGNVLSLYFPCQHEILDKYDSRPGIINQDAANFSPGKYYDLIVSISTLEHVGWSTQPGDPEKIIKAVTNLRSLLSDAGKLVFTVPIGWSEKLDQILMEDRLYLSERYCLAKVKEDIWKETDFSKAITKKYGSSFPFANAILVGVVKK